MGKPLILAFYITVCFIAFITSKIIIAILLYKRWRRKHKVFKDSLSGGKMVLFRSPAMQSLTSDTILKKTMKLTNKDIIGSGGYGTVYRLTIDESICFAVKKLNKGSVDRDRGFERELDAMGDIKHRNIVTLRGYFTAPHFNLLIYDLMPNGSLDGYLHGKSSEKKTLDWPTRHKIAVGAARKRPTDETFVENGSRLVTWVKAVVNDKREEHAIDSTLGSCPVDEVKNVFGVAMNCLESEPSKRPTMAEVLKMLEQIKLTIEISDS
ncbi:hypothetical protein MRB53_036109 [Persea americana]|uniref:Uncharacterized protein n=1 Tax=Persea americana TaxID=3435 RepID=A0ACC2K6L4_PERAE|nr:hypothetical protein MRB53_036109 [Persea americana]